MEMTIKSTPLDRIFPILCIQDGVIISKRGELTIGWEVSLPTIWSMTEEGHDDMLEALCSAVRMLGPKMIVHRQDIYTKEQYHAKNGSGILGNAYERHFDSREHLIHRQYLYLTLAGNEAISRQISDASIFGISIPNAKEMGNNLANLASKAAEFESLLTSRGCFGLERLSEEQMTTLMDAHLRLHQKDSIYSDLEISGSKVKSANCSLWGYSISKSSILPTSISPSKRSELVSGTSSGLHSCTAAAIGPLLGCEHMVNTYIFTINQQENTREMDARKRRMTSMQKNSENKIGAEELSEFMDLSHKESMVCVKAHTNILVWGEDSQEQELRGKVSSALAGMNIICVQDTYSTPVLWASAFPGAAGEISTDNLMTRELKSFLCLGINETFDNSGLLSAGFFRPGAVMVGIV